MATLNVGANSAYKTIAAAVAATQDGDTVLVQAGTYTNDFFTISHKITLQSVGGTVYDIATVSPPNGKAIATVDTDATIDGFGFSGAAVSDNNGAGIRYEAGKLVVNHCVFWGNQDGLLGNADPNGTILIENSEFSANGAGDGFSHNMYIGAVASFTLLNSYVHDAVVGHEVKSRALSNTIQGNRIFDNSGNASYSIDLPNGGVDSISNNVIEKGVNSPNYTTIHFGGEGTPYVNSSLSVTGNTILTDNRNGILVTNATSYTATLSNNSLFGYTRANAGPVSESQDTTLSARPTLDLSTVAPAPNAGTGTTPPTPPSVVVPAGVHLVDPGAGGAVAASGRVLVVGAGKPFTSLASALAASKDGDTIDVMAGTYVNDFGAVTHKVIIQGVGGIAHFTETAGLYDAADLLDVNTDVTLANLEFSGAHTYNGHAGGIGIHAGTVTINNSLFDGNDQSIYTDDSAAISLAIYNSEISDNGNDAKGTHNLRAGAINSLVIKNSAIHGGFSGHEISTSSYNTDIENDRIWDGVGVGASFSIDLSDAGNAVIRNNVIEKGASAANGVVILDGGEGPTYSNSQVVITGNTLISDFQNIYRPSTYFISGAPSPFVAPPTTVSGNVFAGAAPGSQETRNIANVGSNTTAASASIDTTTPGYSAALAPAAPVPSPANLPDTVSVSLTDTAGVTGAQFLVSVDGVVVGGGIVTAIDGSQAPQVFTYQGNWGSGAHTVGVRGLNLTGGNLGASALYVDRVSLDATASGARTALDTFTPSASVTLTNSLPDFDAAFYLAHNPDVAQAGMDPLQHFLQTGWKEGRDPNAFFSLKYYLNQNPDVAASGANPLVQFAQSGWQQGRDPSILFSVSKYLAANPDVARSGTDPLQHYLQTGAAQGRAIYAAVPHDTVTTDPLVDAAYYYAQNPGIAATGQDAGVAYHANVWGSGANPDAYFNTQFYLANNPDVAAAHFDPLAHFEQYGWKEGRNPSAYFNLAAYKVANPGAAASGVDPLVTFLQSGTAPTDVSKSPYATGEAKYFDPAYYLAHNPAVAASQADPLMQYHATGWKQGANPSAAFDTKQYLAHNRDVARARIDPLLHYATYGVYEGRATYAVTGP